ncbi:unnamed protein product [Notodromas monacha]|uniref:Peptidase S54 rhomboid domain-containing protein n=1 Tax=Notodromas monacha TaxID=399045 RepID=A0A7R9GG23_9CRUS|nr:unnamed protein product [Notodromas monacha]CAG0919526.1 unnamed protein product [Notodromas monacha]
MSSTPCRSKSGIEKCCTQCKLVLKAGQSDKQCLDGLLSCFRFESEAPGIGSISESEWSKFEAQCVSVLNQADRKHLRAGASLCCNSEESEDGGGAEDEQNKDCDREILQDDLDKNAEENADFECKFSNIPEEKPESYLAKGSKPSMNSKPSGSEVIECTASGVNIDEEKKISTPTYTPVKKSSLVSNRVSTQCTKISSDHNQSSNQKRLDGFCPGITNEVEEDDVCFLPPSVDDLDLMTPGKLCRGFKERELNALSTCAGGADMNEDNDESNNKSGFGLWIPWVTLLFMGFLYSVFLGLLGEKCQDPCTHPCLNYASVVCKCQYSRLWSSQFGFYSWEHFLYIMTAVFIEGVIAEYFFGHMYLAGLITLSVFLVGLLYIPVTFLISHIQCADELLTGCTLGLSGALLVMLVVLTDKLAGPLGTLLSWILALIPLYFFVIMPYPNTVPLHVAGVLAGWLLTMGDTSENICNAATAVAFSGTQFVHGLSPATCLLSSALMAWASYQLFPPGLLSSVHEQRSFPII